MNKTKIEWCNQTWNPVTGCLHACSYCYAIKQVHRFKGDFEEVYINIHTLNAPMTKTTKKGKVIQASYPFGFEPTFHKYRLEEPQKKKTPQNIFVCSMADLFGNWVPEEWIEKIFDVCNGAPQHRFIFLTKNPKRYIELAKSGLLPSSNNFFFGTTVTTEDTEYWYSDRHNWFLSIEPIMGKFSGNGISGHKPLWEGPGLKPHWVIVGAETGNRKGKVIPKCEWIDVIVNECRKNNVPVFLKIGKSKKDGIAGWAGVELSELKAMYKEELAALMPKKKSELPDFVPPKKAAKKNAVNSAKGKGKKN